MPSTMQLNPHAQYHYMYPSHLVPMTPYDFPYTPMLPTNLLATPSPYMGHPMFLSLQPMLPLKSSNPPTRNYSMYSNHNYTSPMVGPPQPFLRAYLLPVLSFQPQPLQQAKMDNFKLSRTVMVRYISKDVSITELLNEIDVGPIEYCKMFTTQCPSWIKLDDELKSCSISFVNTQVSMFFVSRYAKNRTNLRLLKERLKNSEHLQITLNESVGNSLNNQDFLKVKTMNYIQEHNATRALSFRVLITKEESSELPQNTLDLEDQVSVKDVTEIVSMKFSRFGEIEHLDVVPLSTEQEYDVVLHFTSIDSCIKALELIEKFVNFSEAEHDSQLSFMAVSFVRDRCDRVEVVPESIKRKNTTSSNPGSTSLIPNSTIIKNRTSSFESRLENVSENRLIENFAALEPTLSTHSSQKSSYKLIAGKNLGSVNEVFESYSIDAMKGSVPLDPYRPDDDLVSISSSNSDGLLNLIRGDVNDPFTKSTSYLYLGRLVASSTSLNYPPQSQQSASSGIPVTNIPMSKSFVPPFVQKANLEIANAQNRTLFLGNLHPNTTVEEIANNVRAGGLVEWIKCYAAKHICFITFIDPAVALKFYMMHQVYHQLIIHGNEVSVKWGKNHSGPLCRDIALAVTAGASRNVYIGCKKTKDRNGPVDLPTEEELKSDFAKFGELEQVNIYHKRNCGFVNFLNIADAINLVDNFKAGNGEQITQRIGDAGEFYAKYSQFNVSFGKDRCGNPLKFSFKKRDSKLFSSSEPTVLCTKPTSPERLETINYEAAMVFGILTDAPEGKNDDTDSQRTNNEKSPTKLGKYEKLYVNPDTECFNSEAIIASLPPGVQSSIRDDGSDSESCTTGDDDIAIIIGTGSPKKQDRRRPLRTEKVYHGRNQYFNDMSDHRFGVPMHGVYQQEFDMRLHSYPAQGMSYGIADRTTGRSYPGELQPGFGNRMYSSGSQVMADYLAKLNRDQMIYTTMPPTSYEIPDRKKK